MLRADGKQYDHQEDHHDYYCQGDGYVRSCVQGRFDLQEHAAEECGSVRLSLFSSILLLLFCPPDPFSNLSRSYSRN